MVGVFKRKGSRGRPPKLLNGPDLGTPELQQKRQQWLKWVDEQHKSQTFDQTKLGSALWDECVLHTLFYKNQLDPQQFQTALKIRILYSHYLRSRGTFNRLASISGRWNGIKGRTIDYFESSFVEKKWQLLWTFMASISPDFREIFNFILGDLCFERVDPRAFFRRDFLKTLRYSLDQVRKIHFDRGL